MSMSRPLSNESNIKVPILVSLDFQEKKSEPSKLKEAMALSPTSSFKNTQNNYANINSNQNVNYNHNTLLSANTNLNKNSNSNTNNKISINQFKFSASSSQKLNNNNEFINNKTNFIYFSNSSGNFINKNLQNHSNNNNNNNNNNNKKKDTLPLISNFNHIKESNDIGYLKNARNDEMKLRRLINKRKQNRIELMNNHHFETLRENLKNSSNGMYLTSLLKEQTQNEEVNPNAYKNMNLYKNSSINFQKNENLFQSYVMNSNQKQRLEDDLADKSNSKINIQNESNANANQNDNVISENLNEFNGDSDLDEKNNFSKINKLFSNEAISRNLINDNVKINENASNSNNRNVNNQSGDKIMPTKDSFEEIIEKERKAQVMKKNSIKELRKINHYFISKVLKKKRINALNNSFSYKDIHEEYEGVTEKEAEKLRLENYDLNLLSELSKEESSIDRNRLMRMRNSMLFDQLKLNENEIVPLAFLNGNNANEIIVKNVFTMKLAKKHYLEEEKYSPYVNNNNNNNYLSSDNKLNNWNNNKDKNDDNENKEMNICSSENINIDDFKDEQKQNGGLNYADFLINSNKKDRKKSELHNEKKRYLVQILNHSDDEDDRNLELKKLKAEENQRLLRPSLTLFKNTLYQMKNEINYSQDLNEYEMGLSPYEKLLIKINSLFKNKFEDKGKFINKIKETFMIENQLKIKEEHTKQIDEFYETKLGSLKDSINSIKSAEDLFSNRYLIKFYEYLKHVNLLSEMEKQNLNKLKQNKSELDIEIIKLNSNIHKIRDKLGVYTEYRNFMICVKKRSIEPPAFFADKTHSQEELKKLATRRLIAIEKKINQKRNEIIKLENALKAEIERKKPKNINVKKILIPNHKASVTHLTHHAGNSSFKASHIVSNLPAATASSNNLNTHRELNSNHNVNTNQTNVNLNNNNDYFMESSRNLASSLNVDSTTDLNSNINLINSNNINFSNNNSNNLVSFAGKKAAGEKPISKHDPNYERIMLENRIAEEHSHLDALLKENQEYTSYYDYLTEPIFKTFDEFYSELKNLETDNITLLNKMNEKSTILHRTKMELYEMKAEDERNVKKYQNDLVLVQAKVNELRMNNKDLKDKLNRLIISMRKQTNTNNKKVKSSGLTLKNISISGSNNNFNDLSNNKNNTDLNSLTDRYVVNPLSKTISGAFPADGAFSACLDIEGAESARGARKPVYFISIVNTFNLVQDIKRFEKAETIKALPFEEQALVMLQQIENNINLLLHRHENYKRNPQTKGKLIAVTNAIDKENRAKKCAERMKQVLENHKNMIERVNYKFNRLNVLPKRKCAPRFRPKDSPNPNGVFSSFNFNKNVDDDEHDFLDII